MSAVLLLVSTCTVLARGDDLPLGVVNTQSPKDIPFSPEESLKRITVPDGFRVTLFAGEPDLRRPIAFDFDDRGTVVGRGELLAPRVESRRRFRSHTDSGRHRSRRTVR